MKVKENKGVGLTGFVITILVILLIISVGGCVYLLNNPVKEKVETQNLASIQSNIANSEKNEEEENENQNINITNNNKAMDLVTINDEKNFNEEAKIYEYISEEQNSKEVPFEISYVVNGKNKGKLEIKNKNKIVYSKNIEKNIVEINRLRNGFDSDVFILYEDGTIGKISISDMQKNKYNVIELENYENIVKIQELVFEHENSGPDYVLVAVDNNGKTTTLDAYSV